MKTLSTIFTLLIVAATVAPAQETIRLTLPEAIGVAVENNREITTARLGIDNADAQVDEAFAAGLPGASINTRYTRNLKKQVFYMSQNGVPVAIEIGADNEIGADLTVNQVLYNSAVSTALGTAKTYAKISRQQLRAKTSEVVLDVRRAYYAAQLAREVLRVNESVLQNSQENFRNTSVLYKAGLRPEFDAIRAEVQLANQQPVVVQARYNYETALDNLRLVLGFDDSRSIEIAEDLIRPVSLAKVEPTIEEARRLLQEYNPTLQVLDLNTKVNEDLIKIRKSDYLPTVSLFGSLRLGSQFDKFDDFDLRTTAMAGINVSYTLFNGFRTDAQVEQARVLHEQSKVTLAQVSNALRTQLESSLRRIESARQRIDVSDKTIEQASRGYRIATTSYKAGTGTQLQINDADLALAQARLNQLNAVFEYNMALAELEQLLGNRIDLTPDGNDVKYSAR